MDADFCIVEKPDWISWDEIHDFLWKAHEKNRQRGIIMKYPALPGEEVRKRVDGNGVMLVAIKGTELVGTAALVFKEKELWCGVGKYAYCCFAAVSPELHGCGVYKRLCVERENVAIKNGVNRMMFDTNENNHHEIVIALKNGYHKIRQTDWGDHVNIVLVKWLCGCPYSKQRLMIEYNCSRMKVIVKRMLMRFFLSYSKHI